MSSRVWFYTLWGSRSSVTYTQSNCITRHMTNRSEALCTHTEQFLAYLAARVEGARAGCSVKGGLRVKVAGCSMEGGLRVQGLVVQRREV